MMNTPQSGIVSRVAAIHDLSGFGRSSLTVVLPVLSAMGIQVCPLPTALLSTQTTGFDNYYFLDLTESMKGIISHWSQLGIQFDSVYSGFLGSVDQIAIVSDFIENCRKSEKGVNPLILVDPVLGDDGEPYGPVTQELINGMRELVKRADVITPNYTEAALLLDKPVQTELLTDEIKEYLVELSDLGPQRVIITSIPARGKEHFSSVYAYDKRVHTFWRIESKHLPASYPGTGDMFASVVVGSLLRGRSFPEAADQAVDAVYKAIQETYLVHTPEREGILFETTLGTLVEPTHSDTYVVVD